MHEFDNLRTDVYKIVKNIRRNSIAMSMWEV